MRLFKFLIFSLADLHCALPLADIERILRAVEISPVPRAPEIIMGLVNIHGRIIPVLNIRKLFRLPAIETSLNDQIIIVRTSSRLVALLVDNVSEVVEYREEDITKPEKLLPGIEYLEGVAKLKDGILYIYNLDRFITPEDETAMAPLLSSAIGISAEER